ncbi:hypothetical protein AUJ68_01910 [Candidatus Woesearchaeota archaeon CG1_02_57_44]|nr:MAG: hypothetical protein AUJ68_01910 [Candidatus Woesearchaeota archaeon CG1_02_57_44]
MDEGYEASGKLTPSDEDKLMRSVLAADKDSIEQGMLIQDAINKGIGSFTPDDVFANMVKDYTQAERLYGKRLLSLLTGYSPDYLKRNVTIPEFKPELLRALTERINRLKQDGLTDDEGFTDAGITLSGLVLYAEELERLSGKGTEKAAAKLDHDGLQDEIVTFRRGRYKDIALRRTISTAIRRGHHKLRPEDLRQYTRKSHGKAEIVYLLDSSGSMHDEKMAMAKKAGIALAYAAIKNKDKVGLVAFGSGIVRKVAPTLDFMALLRGIASVTPRQQTDLVLALRESRQLFASNASKHVILLSDAMPNVGEQPAEDSVQAVSELRAAGITVSAIGIGLSKESEQLAQKLVQVGQGRLYSVDSFAELDVVVLKEYAMIR